MLKNIPSILSPALLKVLMEMGHGDEIVIADGNFPSESMGRNCIVLREDGHGVLDAILQLLPLDQYSAKPVALMEVTPGDNCGRPVIWDSYTALLQQYDPQNSGIEMMERYAFYERSKKAYAIIASGETAIYANVLLKKGVVK
ncbi:MAG: RbsD/FucU domain-containing protein [Angelakisella sp.]